MPEIVESELQAIDDHLDRIKSFLWRFVFPLTFAVAIQAAFDSVNRPLWVWAMLPLGVTAVWWAMQMAAQASHLPHREKLILVQAKLSAGEA